MNNSIAAPQHYLEEHGLIYLPELKEVGINLKGLAKLIGCDHTIIVKLIKGGAFDGIVEAQIQTAGGIQSTKFLLENTVIEILEKIEDSIRIKAET
jgi:hypothetical protein